MESVKNAHQLFCDRNVEAIADIYIIPPNQTHEDNLRYAKGLIAVNLPTDYTIHQSKVLGNMGIVLISTVGKDPETSIFAQWHNNQWKLFRNLNLWSNTNRVEHFGLTKDEMRNALLLQDWATKQIANKSQ